MEEPSRRTWEFHDRLFQRAARAYDDLASHGGTYRFIGDLPAPPALRPRHVGIVHIDLPAPLAARAGRQLERGDGKAPLARRDMSEAPVSLVAVGELLHRVARVTKVVPGTPEVPQDVMLRPYPSGGAVHELEFYLAVRACEGLAPGFYHYRSQEHALTRIDGAETPAGEMLEDCASAWGQPGRPPQVLVVLTSRLPRLAWKYAGIAYKISAEECRRGNPACSRRYDRRRRTSRGRGNPELFARATGVSSWEETSIAESGSAAAARRQSARSSPPICGRPPKTAACLPAPA